MSLNIIKSIKHPKLFRPFLGDDLSSWSNWMTALKAIYGGPIKTERERELVKQCTGRDPDKLPREGFDTALFLTGRRSGKSRIAAIIGAFEAVIAGHQEKLSPGELGVLPIVSPSRSQSRIVKTYLRSIFKTPLLSQEVVSETRVGFDLRNGIRIEILTNDWRTVRGWTVTCAIVDEACFFGLEAEAKIKSDTELVRAIQPSLATIGGKLIAISSPYAPRGWAFDQWKRHYGNDASNVLVWRCSSRTMNPTLPQRIIDEAMAEDPAAARSEYLAEWREDVAAFIPRAVVEGLVIKGRKELMPREYVRYFGFVDVSGGRSDASALSIAHMEGRKVVVDLAKQWKAPHSPQYIVSLMVEEIRRYGIKYVTGDAYSGDFVTNAFKAHHIGYRLSEKPKSQLYAELLPRLCSGEIELLDDDTLVTQLSSLERRTRSGGRDIIDHPQGGHDDLSNALAGATVVASCGRRPIGVI